MLRLSIAAIALAIAAPSARAADPTDAPAFKASPASLQRLFSRLEAEPGDGVVLALEEGRYQFDKRGNWTFRLRRIYKIVDARGIDGWDYSAASYAPWYQKPSELRARVIAADGSVSTLDPKSISTEPAPSGAPHTYSDRRRVKAPLPAISVGAIVEEEMVSRTRSPYFAAGSNFLFVLDQTRPVHRVRVVIDAPAGLPLRFATVGGVKLARKRERARGRSRWTFTASKVPKRADPEPFEPADHRPASLLRFSTGRSWNKVAAAYDAIVDAQIAAGPVPDLIARVPRYDGSNRDRVVAAALALVNENVRYTGLELGQAALVPWTPAETWQRKYGDCKDKATLLVALLRGAGLAADVALLDSGTHLDIDPKLPGMGYFDHAIVAVGGGPRIWIDATSELARAGQLPRGDRDRWALLASSKTKRPVRTPRSTAAAHQVTEVRAIALAERGPAWVVETTRWTGDYELRFRYDFRDTKPADLEKRMTGYAKNVFGARLDKLDHGEPTDLEKPLELRLAMSGAAHLYADYEGATVWVSPSSVLNELPEYLTKKNESSQKRAAPMALAPFRKTVTYRATIPEGFRAGALPEPMDVAIGPLRIELRYRESATEVAGTVTLDTGDGRFTAAQVDELRARLPELGDKSFAMTVEQIGQKALEAGRIKEAIAEFKRLARLHPKEALHQIQLADALLRAGLARPAEAAARRAVALEPKSPDALGMLGWLVQHDDIGRTYGPGWRPKEAQAIYRKAIKLAPDEGWLRGNLAIVLSRGADGSDMGGNLAAAAAEYRALRKETEDRSYDYNLLEVLFFDGKIAELEKEAASMTETAAIASLRVAAALITGGEAAMSRKLAEVGGKRAEILEQAILALVRARRYKLAAIAVRASIATSANPAESRARLDGLKHFRRFDKPPFADSDPRSAVAALVRSFSRGKLGPRLEKQLTRRGISAAELDSDELVGMLRGLRRVFVQMSVSDAVAIDGALSITTLSKEPLPGGALVKLGVVNNPKVEGTKYFVIRSRGRQRILATSARPAAVGGHVLALLRRGKLKDARRWLEAVAGSTSEPPLAFSDVWSHGASAGSRAHLTLAAAALAVGDKEMAPAALVKLKRCPSMPAGLARGCARAVVMGHMMRGDWKRAARVAGAFAEKNPKEQDLMRGAMGAALAAGQLEAARRWADKLLALDANDWSAHEALSLIDVARGDHRAARRRFTALEKKPGIRDTDLNTLAWLGLFTGDTGDDAIAAANRSLANQEHHSTLNTLAALRAARGELSDARSLLLRSIQARGHDHLEDADWLVHGRIAAAYGYTGEARRAYRKLKKPPVGSSLMSSYELAQRWLKKLP